MEIDNIKNENNHECTIAELDNELKDLGELYGDIKQNLDKSISNENNMVGTKRVSPKFITDQIANLISLKRTRMDIIKAKADLRKDKLDRDLKIKSIEDKVLSDSTDGGENFSGSDLIKYILSNPNSIKK